jgi:hypothetical protein
MTTIKSRPLSTPVSTEPQKLFLVLGGVCRPTFGLLVRNDTVRCLFPCQDVGLSHPLFFCPLVRLYFG